jgi:hypothetical protein
MLPKEELLLKMSLSEVEHLLHGCSPGSDTWNVVWPVYETKRRRAENKRTLTYFNISTAIALVALIRSFFPPSQRIERRQVLNSPLPKDPLSLFHSNPALEDCLRKVNARDPLGLRSNDANEDRQRQACIAKYISSN